MTIAQIAKPILRTPLRLWPGVVGVVLELLVAWFVAPVVLPGNAVVGVLGGLVGALVIVVWWVFFSRAPWAERLGAVVLMIAGLMATRQIIDISLADAGQGMMFFFLALPVVALALVVGAVAGRRVSRGPRRATMVAAILLACGVWTLLRIDGITGDGAAEYAWRWTRTHEERLLARPAEEPVAPSRARPGTTRCWSTTSCWFATARRWRRSGFPW